MRTSLVIASAAAVFLLAYAGGLTWFLRHRLSGIINEAAGPAVQMQWGDAWTPLPGLVFVQDFQLRYQDHQIEFGLHIKKARLWVAVWRLLRREFAARPTASGVSFLLRAAREQGELSPTERMALPSIAGLGAAGEQTRAPKGTPRAPDDPGEKIFRVNLTGVSASQVHELWFENYHWQGEASARGDFVVKPGIDIQLDNAQLNVASGFLSLGGEADALSGTKGSVDCSIKWLSLPKTSGVEILNYLSGRVRLEGKISSAAFLRRYLRGLSALDFEGGDSSLTSDLQIEKGRLATGSLLMISPKRLQISFRRDHAKGTGRVRFFVHEKSGQLDVVLDDFTVQQEGQDVPRLRGRDLQLHLRSQRLGLAELFEDAELNLILPEAEITDLRLYNEDIPPALNLSLLGGKGTLAGRLVLSNSAARGHGELTLTMTDALAAFGDLRLKGRVKLDARFPRVSVSENQEIFELAGTHLRVERMTVVEKDENHHDWWADVDIEHGALTPHGPMLLDVTARAKLKDAKPIVALYAAKSPLPGPLRDVLSIENISVAAKFSVSAKGADVRELYLKGKQVKLEGFLSLGRGRRRGALLVDYGPLTIGVELRDQSTDWKLISARSWYETLKRP